MASRSRKLRDRSQMMHLQRDKRDMEIIFCDNVGSDSSSRSDNLCVLSKLVKSSKAHNSDSDLQATPISKFSLTFRPNTHWFIIISPEPYCQEQHQDDGYPDKSRQEQKQQDGGAR